MPLKWGETMARITLKDYALRLGKDTVAVRHKAQRGGFHTAEKFGRDWTIDEDEPYIDKRVTSGAYAGWREKFQKEGKIE